MIFEKEIKTMEAYKREFIEFLEGAGVRKRVACAKKIQSDLNQGST